MYAYSNILAALLQRKLDGRGRRIDVSMLEAMGEWMGFPMYYAFEDAAPPPRAGAAHATIFPYGPFPCGDGKTAMLGLQNEREWVVFCEQVLQQPALAQDARFAGNANRLQHRDALHALITEAFSRFSAEQVMQRLDAAQIANAQVNDMAGLWAHPQLAARGRWRQMETPAGPVPTLLPPGSWDDGGPRLDAVPALGQHTDAILAGLGLDAAAIAELRAAAAV
jgi:crotonobetainyl-CoA:carnitine CoA-transferase CaiB-like acyl-CoA transferase